MWFRSSFARFFWLFVVIGCYILTFLIIVSTNSLKRPRAIILSNPLILVTFIMQYILHSSVTEPQLYPETIKQISELQCYTLWHTGMSRNHIKHTAVYFNSICCHINIHSLKHLALTNALISTIWVSFHDMLRSCIQE